MVQCGRGTRAVHGALKQQSAGRVAVHASPLPCLSTACLFLPRPAATYYWLNRVVVPKVPKRESKKKKKAKMSVGESFAFLAGSRWVFSSFIFFQTFI